MAMCARMRVNPHTGRAVDIGAPGFPGLDEAFEHTAVFDWLQKNASNFGFTLSFPRENPGGFIYEPWHCCFHESLIASLK